MDLLHREKARIAFVVAGCVALAVFVWAIIACARMTAVLSVAAAIPLLSLTARRQLAVALGLSAVCAPLIWMAFGTTDGYFLLNRSRLEGLVAEITAVPSLTSLQLGDDEPWPTGSGRTGGYDSYRFINGHRVSRYREQVAPAAYQPILYEAHFLRDLGVSPARHLTLRTSLERLSLSGFSLGPDEEIVLDETIRGGTPWVTSFVYRPDDTFPISSGAEGDRRLAPNWFYVKRG